MFVPFAQGGGEEASTSLYRGAHDDRSSATRRRDSSSGPHDRSQPAGGGCPSDGRADAEIAARRRSPLMLLRRSGQTAVALALVGCMA